MYSPAWVNKIGISSMNIRTFTVILNTKANPCPGK